MKFDENISTADRFISNIAHQASYNALSASAEDHGFTCGAPFLQTAC